MSGDEESPGIFQGQKFWVAQRVPIRSRWIELLQKHGGQLVKLDMHADILIADHARKEAPPGSISWKFIEACDKNGKLEDKSNYLAGPPIASEAAVPIRSATSMTRIPYTAEDDNQLWKWVTDAESRGASLSGNKLYKELEEINPRHTWQSWRDRWVKTLAFRERPAPRNSTSISPRPARRTEYPDPPQNVGRQRVPPSSSSRPTKSSAVEPLPATNEAKQQHKGERSPDKGSLRQQSLSKPVVEVDNEEDEENDEENDEEEPIAGQSFTDEDEELLVTMFDEIEDIDPDQETEAWKAMAKKYYQHTADEWKNFWQEVVRPSEERKRFKDGNGEPSKENHKPIKTSKPKGHTTTRPDNNQASELSDLVQSQRTTKKPETPIFSSTKEPVLQEVGSQESQETSKDLVIFLGALDAPVNLSEKEKICGSEVFLYDICRAVTMSFDKGVNIQRPGRWEEVARLIGVDNSKSNIAILKKKFSPIVGQFFDFEEFNLDMKLQEEAGTNAGDEEDEEEDEENEETNDDVPETPIQSSLQAKLVSKRKHVEISDKASEDSVTIVTVSKDSLNMTPDSRKRQRIDKGKGRELEIPSTPEVFYQRKSNNRPISPQDPETQDFHFPQVAQVEDTPSNDILDNSPSNQIQGETHQTDELSPELDSQSSEAYRTAARGKMDRYMALGYTEEIVRMALATTTSHDQNAAIVMEELTKGRGIPSNLQGVWTAEDDLAMEDEAGIERMKEKHGLDHVEDRLIWLEAVAGL